MDDLDIDRLILDLSQNWTGYISWNNIKKCLRNQNLGKEDPCKVKLVLISLGIAEFKKNGYLDRVKWTQKGIDHINKLKKEAA